MKKETVNKILDKMVETNKIKGYGAEKFEYWNNVPYVELENNEIVFLAETFYHMNALCIKTIYDYSSKQSIINCIDYIVRNSDLLKQYTICSLQELKNFKQNAWTIWSYMIYSINT